MSQRRGLDPTLAVRSYAFDRLAAAVAVIDSQGVILDTNEAWRLFAHLNGGSTESTGRLTNYLSVCDRSDAAGVTAAGRVADGLREILTGDREHFELEYPCPSPTEDRWFLVHASSAPVDEGAGAVIFHVDITARKLMTDRLHALAETDLLTGAPNRRAAIRLIGEELAHATNTGQPVSVLFMDVDDFKAVNDRYGHHAGDELLAKVASRADRTLREDDRLCRFGGDEFVIVCRNLRKDKAARLAERLRTVMSEPFQIGAHEVLTGVSVGLAASTQESTVDSMVAEADIAMYADKRRSPHRHREIEPSTIGSEGFPTEVWSVHDKIRRDALGLRTDVADAVVVTDLDDLRIRSFNRSAEELYGWSDIDVIGLPLNQVNRWVGSEEDRLAADRRLLDEGRWFGVLSIQRHDGSCVTLLGSTTVVRDDRGLATGVVVVSRPASEAALANTEAPVDSVLAAEIASATARGEFEVYYQPIVRLSDGFVLGVEALVRWRHPQRGLLQPDEFIGAAERSGQIVDLGQHVLETACRQVRSWTDAGHDLYLAVNLSSIQLLDDRLPDQLAETLAATKLPGKKLWLEITETTLVGDIDAATRSLHRIRDLGVSISIDDFGTGWASLSYLRQFPVNCLKIDRVFVDGLGIRSRETAIARSIVALADELDIAVVAEGVETLEQSTRLQEMGCRFGQGFLFGRPKPTSSVSESFPPPSPIEPPKASERV